MIPAPLPRRFDNESDQMLHNAIYFEKLGDRRLAAEFLEAAIRLEEGV